MFTGIIQAVGHVVSVEKHERDVRMSINTGKLDLNDAGMGDSIAVSGVCLTVIERMAEGFWADVSRETLNLTTMGAFKAGSRVNLEKSLTPASHLGGHFVTGHVDGVGMVCGRYDEGRSVRINIKVPERLAKYIAVKGSVCVDGVSLTVNEVTACEFGVNIVPHTLQETTMGDYAVGQGVNIEVDIIARYLERLMFGEQAGKPAAVGITPELLRRSGFMHEGD